MKSCKLTFLAILFATGSFAQRPDSLTNIVIHYHDSATRPETKISNKRFITSLIIPTAFIGYGVLTLNNHTLREVNTNLKQEVLQNNPAFRTDIDDYMQLSPAIAVYVLNAAGVKGRHGLVDRTLILTISVALEQSVCMILKSTTNQLRPDASNHKSFPSGHTANGFATAEFLYQEYKHVSPLYGIAGYVVASATGALRMYNNRHWFSDVVAGAGIGMLSTKIVYHFYPWLSSKMKGHKKSVFIPVPYFSKDYFGVTMVRNF